MRQKGGDIIGTGSYGCVFKPPIKCKNRTRKKKGISKLMTKENGLTEMMISKDIVKRINVIPKHNKYFIVSNNFCVPDKLTNKDNKQMQRHCEEDLVDKYKSGETLIIHNQPYGGKNLHIIVKESSNGTENMKLSTLKNITLKLKDLILNGIIPLHKMNVYHTDIKPQNLVWNSKTIKLIDWGLATINIPETDYNVMHFNRPYESILLELSNGVSEDEIDEHIMNYVNKNKENIIQEPLKTDMTLFFILPESIEKYSVLINYIKNIAKENMDSNKFDKKKFVKKFYKKQDYWGLVYCYIDILKTLHIKKTDINEHILQLCNLMVSGGAVKVENIIKYMDKIIAGI